MLYFPLFSDSSETLTVSYDSEKMRVKSMNVQICIGSSCHLKGSRQIVELFQQKIDENKLQDKITLSGNFCIGRCNREGVTIQIDDDIFTGITPETFEQFYQANVIPKL